MTVSGLDVLRRAFNYLDEGYATGFFAYNDAGNKVNPCDKTATSFCSLGALARATSDIHLETQRPAQGAYSEALFALSARAMREGHSGVAAWHDVTPRHEVIKTWQETIAALSEHEPVELDDVVEEVMV